MSKEKPKLFKGKMSDEEVQAHLDKEKPQYVMAGCIGEQQIPPLLDKYSKDYRLVSFTCTGWEEVRQVGLLSPNSRLPSVKVPKILLIFERKEYLT